MILKVGHRLFYAHKAILGARSSVFADMFENEFKECKMPKVEITDMDSGAFQELLRFIYTGRIESANRYMEELYMASDKVRP